MSTADLVAAVVAALAFWGTGFIHGVAWNRRQGALRSWRNTLSDPSPTLEEWQQVQAGRLPPTDDEDAGARWTRRTVEAQEK